MVKQFLLIINKQDEGKFNFFKNRTYNKATKEILKKNNATFVWGIHKGIINSLIWNKIKKNDDIFLTLEQETFKTIGKVTKKLKNLKIAESLYSESLDKKQINYFLFFDKLDTCRIPYRTLKRKSKSTIFENEGIYEILEDFHHEKIARVRIKKLPFETTIGKAKKRRREVQGFIRNTSKVNKLKEIYNNKCQIVQCDFSLEYLSKNKKKSSYSEVHHYNPLKNESDDDWGNMIVLCPNHHTEFDFRVKFIHHDVTTIINQDGKETGETIKFSGGHKLNMKNIESLLCE